MVKAETSSKHTHTHTLYSIIHRHMKAVRGIVKSKLRPRRLVECALTFMTECALTPRCSALEVIEITECIEHESVLAVPLSQNTFNQVVIV